MTCLFEGMASQSREADDDSSDWAKIKVEPMAACIGEWTKSKYWNTDRLMDAIDLPFGLKREADIAEGKAPDKWPQMGNDLEEVILA